MKITLLACYEQGRQPLTLASPLAFLRRAGHDAQAFDISIQAFPTQRLIESSLIAISTPMHTALRLAVEAAERIRLLNPDSHICFYGSYAWLNADLLFSQRTASDQALIDSAIGGEHEASLLALARRLEAGQPIDDVDGLNQRC